MVESLARKRRLRDAIVKTNPNKILIADDEVFNLQALKGILRVLGVPDYENRVVSCFNGKELVDLVEKSLDED